MPEKNAACKQSIKRKTDRNMRAAVVVVVVVWLDKIKKVNLRLEDGQCRTNGRSKWRNIHVCGDATCFHLCGIPITTRFPRLALHWWAIELVRRVRGADKRRFIIAIFRVLSNRSELLRFPLYK